MIASCFSIFFRGVGGQRIFLDHNGDAEVDLTLMDMRWPYTSKLESLFQYREL